MKEDLVKDTSKWAYHDKNYPDEGCVGPFYSEQEAREHSEGYEDPVVFIQLTEEQAAKLELSS